MTSLLWVLFAFACGSLPFSYWIGKVFLHVDIRRYGDGNPGGSNAWRAGGKVWGMIAILADAIKGLIPVLLAQHVGALSGWPLAAVAVAALLGHAYSPLLGLRGGKALAITFGVWTGLAAWQAPVVLGITLALALKLLRNDGRAVLTGMVVLLIYGLAFNRSPVLLAVWAANTLLLLVKYRADLRGQTMEVTVDGQTR
ncbi:MAG: glycerol-3-phosphate acyltransferase [Caldilineales bacterium]